MNNSSPQGDFKNYVKKNRVFILGAGFSAGAGIPLTASLLRLAMDKFAVECNGLFQCIDGYARESIECYDDNGYQLKTGQNRKNKG